eukprot:CAMPEP_0119534916 /NCGR_PEP_ID=MMETSP1344-20130328/48063_1 /TAXON_ID=236787 /ORGANISM="Florenciella parvula, Strain CCMP2471" /LENGTH=68 /DNA_ID=CAMNT_0007576345 /DNA_START=153 /DNA_END=356 /DNA_ORIENTATION=-
MTATINGTNLTGKVRKCVTAPLQSVGALVGCELLGARLGTGVVGLGLGARLGTELGTEVGSEVLGARL